MSPLRLRLRTPLGPLIDRPVRAIVAEDLDGWFGIRPGRRDLAAVLPPGLLTFVDQDGEGFAALSGGLLDLRDGECRVMVREAIIAQRLEDVAELVRSHIRGRRQHGEVQRDVLHDLAREALRRLAEEERQ